MTDAHFTDRDYCNCWRDQHYSFCNTNTGFKLLTLELTPDIIVKEEEDGFSSLWTSMTNGIILHTHLSPMMIWEIPTHLCHLTMINLETSLLRRIFALANVNHKSSCLKPINILFDTGWNLIYWIIFKIVCLILFRKTGFVLFYTTSVSAIVTHTTTKVHMSVKSIMTNTWNLLPAWVSKSPLQQKKKHNKTSNGAG